MNTENLTTVTYNFADGSKVGQPVNKQSFEGGKKGNKTEAEMHQMFRDTAWDKRAISYTLEGMDEIAVEPKEIHFSKADKKQARRDYKEIKKQNPAGFANQLGQFRAMVADRFSKNQRRLRFNLKKIEMA